MMETYKEINKDEKPDKSKPNLITYVDLEPAHEQDPDALQPAIDNTQSRGCAPEELQCDTKYGSDENVQKAKEKGVTIIAPTMGPKESPKVALKDFTFDDETSLIKSCPEGHKPQRVNKTKSNNFSARFSKEHCIKCSRRNNCPVKFRKRATYIQYNEKQLRLARRRAYEETSEFRDKYRWRSGIEGSFSHYKSETGAGHLRVRGLSRVRFSVVLKALGLNILRSTRALSYIFLFNFMRIFGLKTNNTTVESSSHLLFNYLSKNNKFYEFAL